MNIIPKFTTQRHTTFPAIVSSTATTLARLIMPAAALAATCSYAATVFQDDFTAASIDSVWNDTTNSGTLDTANDQYDYSHSATGTSRRFVSEGSATFTGKIGYMKATISNFSGSAGVYMGFIGTNSGNSGHYVELKVPANGTYELFFNNTAGDLNFNNNAGWSGVLSAGSGVYSTNGTTTTDSLTFGSGVAADTNLHGFGFANFGNASNFPASSFSIDSILIDDSLDLTGGGANNDPSFNSNPIIKSNGVQSVAYSSEILTDATDLDGDALTFTKSSMDSAPGGATDWLTIGSSDGALSGTPTAAGIYTWTISVSDGNGGTDGSATLEITVESPPTTATIVEWGELDPDANPASLTVVSASYNFDTPSPTTFSTASVAEAAGYYDYTDATITPKSEEFYTAATNYQAAQIQNSGYDRIRITQANDTGDTEWETMVVWTDFFVGLGSDNLDTLSYEGYLATNESKDFHFVIQTASGWYATSATPVTEGGAQNISVADASTAAWFDFSPIDSSDAVGSNVTATVATPNLSDVIAVGLYVYHAAGGAAATEVGAYIGYFQATIDGLGVEPNSNPTFTADPIVKAAGTVGTDYTGETLAGLATDPDAGAVFSYSVVSGPAWLNVATDGTLSGAPNATGSPSSWTVQVSDGQGGSDTAELQITIDGSSAPFFEAATLKKTHGVVGDAYVNAITGSAIDDQDIHLTFAKVSLDTQPGGSSDWLTLASNGALSGTPTEAGTYQWTISATDSDTNSDTATLEIVVDATAGPAKPTNVVVIISDDAGYADFSFMDGLAGSGALGTAESIVPTPHLDELSNRGVTLARAYVAANCQPTRSAIVTGAYQQRIGNENVGNNLYQAATPGYEDVYEGIPTEIDTAWDRFKALGLRTGAIGKWHLGSMPDSPSTYGYGNRPERQGIDFFVGMWHGSRFFDMGAFTNPSGSQQVSMIRKVEVTDHTPAALAYTDSIVENNGTPGYPNFADDPIEGYVTTVFGKASAEFVETNYSDPNGFFLYVAHPAPHKPWETNSPDYNDPRIASMPDTVSGGGQNFRKIVASMTISMDKEIGRLMDTLEDPNGDGDVSDSILNNTMVIFINDNGGVSGSQTDGVNGTDNGWFDGFKGSAKEGGIRVPAIIAGAGIDAIKANTIYHKAVHGVDIVPTALAVTGNALTGSETNIDGVNILPHINADTAAHDLLVHRWRGNFTVIKGDYHLVNTGNNGQTNNFRLYKTQSGDALDDYAQATNLLSGTVDPADQARADERFRDLTDHEVKFDKSRYPILARNLESEPLNVFDHFVFRPNTTLSDNDWFGNLNLTGTGLNRTPDGNSVSHWHESGNTTDDHFLLTSDGCSQTVLEFPVYNSGNYTANNDLRRQTGQTFLLNKILLTGDYAGASNAAATISGLDLLLAKSLDGVSPKIILEASNTSTPEFTFDLDLDLVLYDDLILDGLGNASLNINGELGEYEPDHYAPRGLTKMGDSVINVTGAVSYTGDTHVDGGTLSFSQVNSQNDASLMSIEPTAATLELAFVGTDTVNALFIGLTQQAAGVYGAIGSGAENEIAQITGSGTLTVTSGAPATAYSTWASTNAGGQAADSDFDFDGVANGIEHFMGETGSSFTALPSPDATNTVTWSMAATYSGDYGTDYFLQSSTPDLNSWQTVLAEDVTIVSGVSISYTLPTGSNPFFVRLVVD